MLADNSQAISIKKLTKRYKNGFLANDDINLYVNSGEVVGLIGLNGAGKTTFIRQLLGLLKPTSGEIAIKGIHPTQVRPYRDLVAYVPQNPLYYPSLTPSEVLEFSLISRKTNEQNKKEIISTILQELDINEYKDTEGYRLSPGIHKSILLALALIKNAPVIIMDEPTNLVDIQKQRIIWDRLLAEKQRNKAILLTSHNINEIRSLCDRIYFIASGKIIANGRQDELFKEYKTPLELSLSFEDESLEIGKLGNIQMMNGFVKTSFENIKDGIRFLEDASNLGDLSSILMEGPSLENVIARILREK
ncbi:MAG: ABC transporter ATP-binding protein [Anaerolineaceae bacterium]